MSIGLPKGAFKMRIQLRRLAAVRGGCRFHTIVMFDQTGTKGSVLKKHLQSGVYVFSVKDIVLAGKPFPVCNGYAQGDREFLFGKRGNG